MPSRPFLSAALLSLALIPLSAVVHAEGPQAAQVRQEEQAKPRRQGSRVLRFVAGAVAGLVVHEAGHVSAGLMLRADPGFKRLDYGFVPFFAVTHDPVSRRREFLISSAGFHAQHLASEWLLWPGPPGTAQTRLRDSSGAFKKGWLAFNLATSAVYTAAAFGRFGPLERDTRGMAVGAGVPEPVIGLLILAPAALDGVRYAAGDPAWARWSSRALKAGLVLLAVK